MSSVKTGGSSVIPALRWQPDEIGGFETQSPYLVVGDADEVYRKVKGDGRPDRHRDQGRGLRRAWLQLPRPRRPPVERRDLRSLG
jgi:hypothetical protein